MHPPDRSSDASLREFYDELVPMLLEVVEQETPNYVEYCIPGGPAPTAPNVKEIFPAFYGCFDWHSAVHTHWSLVWLLKAVPEAEWAMDVRSLLNSHLSFDRLGQEFETLAPERFARFERPYGLAWLLKLAEECRTFEDADASRWTSALEPLRHLCRDRMLDWLPTLPGPNRTGEHGQTAFAMSLLHEVAVSSDDSLMWDIVRTTALRFHEDDRNPPWHLEPSAYDFLSPTLAAADLMSRVLGGDEFLAWFDQYFPAVNEAEAAGFFTPVAADDKTDGKLVHVDGLCLSRAWMLEQIAMALPFDDARGALFRAASTPLFEAGVHAIDRHEFAGSHWLGTFALRAIASVWM